MILKILKILGIGFIVIWAIFTFLGFIIHLIFRNDPLYRSHYPD